MPRQVEFKFGGHGLVAALDKVNRSEVYGWSDVEVLDKEGGARRPLRRRTRRQHQERMGEGLTHAEGGPLRLALNGDWEVGRD